MLWDVDGTLLFAGGVTRDVFDVAAEHVLGRPPGDHQVAMAGRTDTWIAKQILAFAGVADDDMPRHLPALVSRLEAGIAAALDRMRERGRVLPGVEAVLERLHGEPSVLQSVLTGNTAANAAAKLAAFGLDRWLDLEVAALGSDHHDREELVPVALDRARQRRGRELAPEQVWVVGDTPQDLACAKAGGARCVLVGTGSFPPEELEGLGADHVLVDLSNTEQVCALLLG